MPKTNSRNQLQITDISLAVLASLAVAVALFYAKDLLIPFVLGVFVTIIAAPLVDFLVERCKIHRGLAIALTLLLLVVAAVVFVLGAASSLQSLIGSAGQYRERIFGFTEHALALLERYQINVDRESIVSNIKELPIFLILQNVINKLVGLSGMAIFVLIYVMFLLPSVRSPRKGLLGKVDRTLRLYLSTKTLMSAATGILTWGFMALLGVDLALLFGVLTFLLNFIPTVGSIIAVLLPLPVVILQFGSLGMVLLTLLGPGLLQFTIGSVLEPKIMGKSLGLHPAAVLLTLMFWGLVWGPIGMFLAVPITTVIKIVLEQFDNTKSISRLLEGNTRL